MRMRVDPKLEFLISSMDYRPDYPQADSASVR